MNEHLINLRDLMAEKNIDIYLVPTADFHESEYVGDYFKCREYLTGFTGSAGTAVVTADFAGLWTDGRYFIQAERELAGSDFTLMKMGQDGVPTVEEYIKENLPIGGTLGFDGRVVNSQMGLELKDIVETKDGKISCGEDLIDEIWEERPALSAKPVWILDVKYTGRSAEDKIKDLRHEMKEAGADVHIITTIDDIAWLLNIRGDDVMYNPVVLSYAIITDDDFYLFINDDTLDDEVKAYLDSLNVTIRPYNDVYEMAGTIHDSKVLLETGTVNFALLNVLDQSNRMINKLNPTTQAKAVKNKTEIENEKEANIKDGVAVTKFIYWLKKNIGKIPITEISASDRLDEFRAEQEGYLGLSFETISAYGENAAMCHYSATPETDKALEPRGLYLIDSGGQYLDGTTDITRTVALGSLTDEEREHFTLVLMSMLRLGDARFLYGCRGLSLDYADRELFWRRNLNFDHGTGHGIGYLLNVHERPNGIRFRMIPERMDNAVIEDGMICSDEPGLYIEGSHGVRCENLILARNTVKNEYGQFMAFEYLTFVPFDIDALDLSLMEQRDIDCLNQYHKEVYEKISPYLDDEETEWLKEATRPVTR